MKEIVENNVVISRRLGQGENFFRCRFELEFYRQFGSWAAYSRDLTKDLPLFFRALRKTILDYHVLICNVFKDNEKGYTVCHPIEQATFGDLVHFTSDLFSPEGKQASEEYLNFLCRGQFFKLNEHSPLFRVFISGTHDLGATFEHTMADGVVALYFHEVFLESLAYCDNEANAAEYEILYGTPPESVDMSTVIFNFSEDRKYLRNSLPPTLEMGMRSPDIDYSDNDPLHYSKVVPAKFPEKWPGRYPAEKECSVAFKLFNFTPAQVSHILKMCKANGVTFTSFLSCVQALALQPIYGDKHHTLSMVAITLRRFLSVDKVPEPYKAIMTKENYRLFGMFAHMGVPEFFAPVYEFSWDHVRSINSKMVQSLKNDKLLSLRKKWYDEALEIDDNRVFFESELGKNKADAIKISNLGLGKFPIFDMGDLKEPWAVNDIVFAQDTAPNASEFVLDVVSSPRGGLNIVMSYFTHRFDDVPREIMETLPQKIKDTALSCVGL